MNQANIYERINKIFQDVFDDDTITVNAQTMASDIDEWDSLEHINLIVSMEEEFGMKFTIEEVTGMENVGAMVKIIEERATK